MGRRVQQIDYENVPFACFHYKKERHKEKICPIFKEKVKFGKAQNKQGKNMAGAPRKVWKEKALEGKNPRGEVREGNDKRDLLKERISLAVINEFEKMDQQ